MQINSLRTSGACREGGDSLAHPDKSPVAAIGPLPGIPRDLDAQITELKVANLDDLNRRWKIVFGKPYPSHLPRHLMVGILAYRLQANAHGDLSQHHKKYLDALGRASVQGRDVPTPSFASERMGFKSGTVFVREHDGVEHRVTVTVTVTATATATAEGLSWSGRTYSSLSAIARAIAGTNWNGRRFFGLPAARG